MRWLTASSGRNARSKWSTNFRAHASCYLLKKSYSTIERSKSATSCGGKERRKNARTKSRRSSIRTSHSPRKTWCASRAKSRSVPSIPKISLCLWKKHSTSLSTSRNDTRRSCNTLQSMIRLARRSISSQLVWTATTMKRR